MSPVYHRLGARARRVAYGGVLGALLFASSAAPRPIPGAVQHAPHRRATANLTVTAAEFRNRTGHARFALYTVEDSWLDNEKAFRVATVSIESTTVKTVFRDLTPGVYAAAVFHDENDNGKLDMRYFPFPKPREGAGVSNNHRRLGKPRWSDATFTLPDTGATIVISLAY